MFMDTKYRMELIGGKTYSLTQREYEEIMGRMVCIIPFKIIVNISGKRVVLFTKNIIVIEEI